MKLIFSLICLLLPLGIMAKPYNIELNEKEKYAIYEIIKSMGEKGLARLLIDGSRLSRLGRDIRHIHPLQFIGYIVSEPYLVSCLHIISKSYFKWEAFLDGFSTNMQREQDEGKLSEEIIREFASYFKFDYNKLHERACLSDWDGFVRVML